MKLNSVQYLRGLAALLVVIAHAADHPLRYNSVLLYNLGELGVTLFFVISGFIMVAISGTGGFSPLTFLKRRVVRVVPLYWLFTTLAAVLALVLPGMFKSTIFSWGHYLQSLLFIPHEAPGKGGYSPILSLGWTLNYEMFFYVAFAACAALSALWRVMLLSVIFGALGVYGMMAQPTNLVVSFYTDAVLLAFCAGAWIGLWFISGGLARLPVRLARLTVAAGMIAMPVGLALDSGLTFYCLLAASALLLIGGVRLEPDLPRVKLLSRLGDASYSTYLVHMFVVGAVVVTTARLLPFDTILEYGIVVFAAVVVSIVIGLITYDGVEKPLLRLFGVRMGGVKAPRPGRPAMVRPG